MDDASILSNVHALIEEEHQLRLRVAAQTIDPAQEQHRLRQLEESLDQCWDLLRQRRARRETGQDPEGAAPRGIPEVEGYLQ